MGHILSIKDRDGKYQQYSVDNDVYVYVRQLENCVRRPDESKLRERYPERFGKKT